MSGGNDIKVLDCGAFNTFINNLIGVGPVAGVRKKEGKYAFGRLSAASGLCLDYDVTILPPKKYFLPQRETLFSFSLRDKPRLSSAVPDGPLTIVGVHPYDLIAINQLDKLFAATNRDEIYLKRRESITIIAADPKRASKWSFWSYMDAAYVKSGFDLFITDLGDRYAVEIGSKRGKKLIKKHTKAKEAQKEDIEKRARIREGLKSLCLPDRRPAVGPDRITSLMEAKVSSEAWGKEAEKCYSCGSCNLVCPTCYCFDVRDDLELNLKDGERIRTWDGCLLTDFAVVAGGENFRKERKDRFRHRLFRKGVYIRNRIGELACVGCGRCSSACLPNIADPVKMINALAEDQE